MAALKRRKASSTSAGVHCGNAPTSALLSAALRCFGPLTLAAVPARAFFKLCWIERLALGFALRFAAFLTACLGVFRAMLPYIEPHAARQRSQPRTHHLFGRADAQPVAEPDRIPDLHGGAWWHQLRGRRDVSDRGRLADLRFFRARCAPGLLGVPGELPFCPRLRGGDGDAIRAHGAQGQPPRPGPTIYAQSDVGTARLRSARGVRRRAAVPGIPRAPTASRGLPRGAREGGF